LYSSYNIINKIILKKHYKRTSGKHVKAEPKKEEWESLNRNGALGIYI
jgi:hypothetical protein